MGSHDSRLNSRMKPRTRELRGELLTLSADEHADVAGDLLASLDEPEPTDIGLAKNVLHGARHNGFIEPNHHAAGASGATLKTRSNGRYGSSWFYRW